MKIIKGERDKLEKLASDFIADKIDEVIRRKELVVLGAVGGTSVKGIYAELSKEKIEWNKIHVFMLDERFVPLNSEDSNFKIVKENLKKGNLHPFDYNKSLFAYQKEFDNYGNFDIVLLSAGEDGHVASLYPNHASVRNNLEGFISVENSPKPPARRISSSRKLIENAGYGVLLFFGEGKKEAYKKFNDDEVSVVECPSKIIKEIKDSLVLVGF